MSTTPTAEEFYDKSKHDSILDIMVEFAKLHVEQALKEASNEALTKNVKFSNDVEVDKDSILNAYPLDNIK